MCPCCGFADVMLLRFDRGVRMKALASCVLVYLSLALVSVGAQQPAPAPQDSVILSQLPPELRAEGQAMLGERVSRVRARKADVLGAKGAAKTRAFLLSVLREEKEAAVRRAILDRVARTPDDSVL